MTKLPSFEDVITSIARLSRPNVRVELDHGPFAARYENGLPTLETMLGGIAGLTRPTVRVVLVSVDAAVIHGSSEARLAFAEQLGELAAELWLGGQLQL